MRCNESGYTRGASGSIFNVATAVYTSVVGESTIRGDLPGATATMMTDIKILKAAMKTIVDELRTSGKPLDRSTIQILHESCLRKVIPEQYVHAISSAVNELNTEVNVLLLSDEYRASYFAFLKGSCKVRFT